MFLYNGIRTFFKMSYPPTSAYEFEYLKTEEDVQEIWKKSTIYMLCQKKVFFFNDLTNINCEFKGYICQKGDSNKLKFHFDLLENQNLFPTNGEYQIDIQFLYEEKDLKQPYKEVAGIKIFDDKEEFLGWLNPERLICEYLIGRIKLTLEGEIGSFLNYHIHYIGQSQEQWIWERLTGHEKLSKILATVFPLYKGEFNPYEHTIILFHLEEYHEDTMLMPNNNIGFPADELKVISNQDLSKSDHLPDKTNIENKIVNDFEAFLINLFEPKYNKIRFKGYPKIKNGLKSIGYASIVHQFLTVFSLNTEECQYNVRITPIYKEADSNE